MKPRSVRLYSVFCALLLTAGATPAAEAAMSVSLDSSIPAPAAVGAAVTWSANVSAASSGTLWYRFRVRLPGRDFRTVRDYGPSNTLLWTASEQEGDYEIEVSVRNADTGETEHTSVVYPITTRIIDGAPIISKTENPLVFLYSAPACAPGDRMRVQFQSPDGFIQRTPYKACRPASMNF